MKSVIDLSHHNALPHGWGQTFHECDVLGVIHKASQRVKDEKYDDRRGAWDGKWGAYHFLEGGKSASEQAELFVASAKVTDDMMLVVDVEHNPMGGTATRQNVIDFVNSVWSLCSHVCVLYITVPMLEQMNLQAHARFNRLWTAEYTTWMTPRHAPPKNWKHIMWQFTQSGEVGASIGPVDISRIMDETLDKTWSTKI